MGNAIQYSWSKKDQMKLVAQKHNEKMLKQCHDEIEYCVKKSKIYSNRVIKDTSNTVENVSIWNTNFIVEDMTSTEAIMKYANDLPEGGSCAVLNFASYRKPGGMFLEGSIAQEECLCHDSFLYNVLSRFPKYYEWNEEHKNYALYTNRAIYTPEMIFFADENDKRGTECDVITCAAPNIKPSRKYGWGITDEMNRKALIERIKFILDIAASNQVDTLILGAFGCGVFGQDPGEVASIFMHQLTNKFYGAFRNIIFAVPNSNNNNYKTFKSAVESYI